jgi:hypothetical protein
MTYTGNGRFGACAVCAHEIQGAYGFAPSRDKPIVWSHTAQCAELARKNYGKDMTNNEEEALKLAGRAGGEFLESKGLADTPLGQLAPEEYQAFLAKLFDAWHHELFRLAGGDKAPF